MGVILAKFRKEKTTYEVLEKLEQDIKDIEEYSVSTQAQQKRFVGNFLVISIGLYVIGFIIFYFVFFPPTWTERITYSVPMLIIPLLIFLIKRLVAWYFQRKLNKNSRKLTSMRAEKKKIIEKVLDTETYKVAIEILNRFGGVPKTDLKSPGSLTPRLTTTSATPIKMQAQSQSLTTYRGPSSFQQPKTTIQQVTINPNLSPSISPRTPIRNTIFNNNNTINSSGNLTPAAQAGTGIVAQRNTNLQVQPIQQRKRTPYPIINQGNKGVLEKMVDYLIGDGPHNRFAMICKECYGHNGMALQEEYEYAAFRCAFCGTMNPSRKSRPIAPKLPMATPTHAIVSGDDMKRRRESSSSSTSTSEKDSGPDTDDEARRVPKNDDIKPSISTENIATVLADNNPAEGPVGENGVDEEPMTEKDDEDKKND